MPWSERPNFSEVGIGDDRRKEGIWEVYDKRYQPDDTLDGHLGFALRHEPIDLLVLKRILDALPEQDLIEFIQRTPTGAVTRRV